MNEISNQARRAAETIITNLSGQVIEYPRDASRVSYIGRIIDVEFDKELQDIISSACRAHREKQELLIAFIRDLAASHPILEYKVKDQFERWNLPREPNGQPAN